MPETPINVEVPVTVVESPAAAQLEAEVSEVQTTLVEHAETSEDRHEEILEGQAQCENELTAVENRLTAELLTLRSQVTTLLEALTEQSTILRSLQASTPLIPVASVMPVPIPEPEPAAQLPSSDVEENPAPETHQKRYKKI